jgi:uncharacterized membrane protein YheB (UPF0754 family)
LTDWVLTPLIGAVIGYFTNWLAIKMLFRPREEKRFFGIPLPFTPGLIPKERRRLAQKVGETLSAKVLTADVLAGAISSGAVKTRLSEIVDGLALKASASDKTVSEIISGFFGESFLERVIPPAAARLLQLSAYLRDFAENQPEADAALRKMTAKIAKEQFGGFVGIFVNYEKIYDNIKNSLCDYMEDGDNGFSAAAESAANGFLSGAFGSVKVGELFGKLPDGAVENVKAAAVKIIKTALEKGGAHLARSMDIGRVVEEKINSFGMDEAERIIIEVVSRELKMITWLGALLGLIIGFAPPIIALLR